MTYAQFAAAASPRTRGGARPPVPLNRSSYERLLRALPAAWIRAVRTYSDRVRGRPRRSLRDILASEPPLPLEWVQLQDGLVAQINIDGDGLGTHYEARPSGFLQIVDTPPGTTFDASGATAKRVVVWRQQRLDSCLLEREAWERARARGDEELQPGAPPPPNFVLGGPLLDLSLLDSTSGPCMAARYQPHTLHPEFRRYRQATRCCFVRRP